MKIVHGIPAYPFTDEHPLRDALAVYDVLDTAYSGSLAIMVKFGDHDNTFSPLATSSSGFSTIFTPNGDRQLLILHFGVRELGECHLYNLTPTLRFPKYIFPGLNQKTHFNDQLTF